MHVVDFCVNAIPACWYCIINILDIVERGGGGGACCLDNSWPPIHSAQAT